MSVVTVTTLNFRDEVLNAPKGLPVLVDFWASWCGPCKMLSPVVDQIAEEVDGVKVCKVNVDEEPDLAAAYGVESIPTLILFRDGEIDNQMVGVRPKAAIVSMISG
ncbi:MAG: thioredoxin [Oscillospiraceae bacterium]|nr:thioredoxin [Oscillospiraceae bacterium]